MDRPPPRRDDRDDYGSRPYRRDGYADRPPRRDHTEKPPPSEVVGVFGLSVQTRESDLDHEFSRFGTVESVNIVYDQRVSPFVHERVSHLIACHPQDRTISWLWIHPNGEYRGCAKVH